MKLIDGKELARSLRGEIAAGVAWLKAEKGVTPGLAVILVGDNPASVSYVTAKRKACAEAGMLSREIRLPAETTEEELVARVKELNADPEIHGILVQLPVPKHLDEIKIIEAIDPSKDVDCFSPVNTGRLYNGNPYFLPCTPAGIIELIKASCTDISGKTCVVIGRSNIVGKPIAALLMENDGTVTVCHRRTPDLKEVTQRADILVVAMKKPDFITADYVKPGAVIIDVGINRKPDGKVTGDVDFESCYDKCGFITPVPGGVGPMTVTMLLDNTVKAARLHVS